MTKKERMEFEARYGDQSNVIRIGRTPKELIGVGTEYLVVEGTVIAKFYDGDFVRSNLVLVKAEESTITAA